MKKATLNGIILSVLSASNLGHSQIKVDHSGLVGVGTTSTNPWFNLHLGNTSKGGLIHSRESQQQDNPWKKYFRAGQSGQYSAVVGTSSDRINFWYGGVNYNVIKYQYAIEESDIHSKENITPLQGGMDKLLQLKTYTYDFIDEADHPNRKKSYGFSAQEVNTVLPNLTDTSHGIMGIKTTQLIPFLVDGTQQLYYENQEQALLIDSLVKRVSDLEKALSEDGSSVTTHENDPVIAGSALYQNEPNPFKETTTIRYVLPAEYGSASIMVFTMDGGFVDQYEISGSGTLVIEGETLAAGMYMYSLIVDGREVGTKRFIHQQ